MSSKPKPKADKPDAEIIDAQTPETETNSEVITAESLASGEETGEITEPGDEQIDAAAEDMPAVAVAAPVTTDLHQRLTSAVRQLGIHAGQDTAFALHQLEILTGRLKFSLPAGIAAAKDDGLKSGLEALLTLL